MIVDNRKVSSGYYSMRIACPEVAAKSKPGQFVMVRITTQLDPLLRRPFGIHRLCTKSGAPGLTTFPTCIEILYRVTGKGTFLLSQKKRGEEIDLIGPLGKGFRIDHTCRRTLLVAGGLGIAPLFWLAEVLHQERRTSAGKLPLTVFVGGKTKEDILCVKDLRKLGAKVLVSTEDGSMGTKGMVTGVLLSYLEKFPSSEGETFQVFACGPLPMLRQVSEITFSRAIPCQISLESRMACGVGACLGCCIPTRADQKGEYNYQRVCREGPVFDSRVVVWDGEWI